MICCQLCLLLFIINIQIKNLKTRFKPKSVSCLSFQYIWTYFWKWKNLYEYTFEYYQILVVFVFSCLVKNCWELVETHVSILILHGFVSRIVVRFLHHVLVHRINSSFFERVHSPATHGNRQSLGRGIVFIALPLCPVRKCTWNRIISYMYLHLVNRPLFVLK